MASPASAHDILSPLTYGRFTQIKSEWDKLMHRYGSLGKPCSKDLGFENYIETHWTTEQLMDSTLDLAPSITDYILFNWDVHRRRALLRHCLIRHFGFMPKFRHYSDESYALDYLLEYYTVNDKNRSKKERDWYGLSRYDKMKKYIKEVGSYHCHNTPADSAVIEEPTYYTPSDRRIVDHKLIIPASQQLGDVFSYKKAITKKDGTVVVTNHLDIKKDLSKNPLRILKPLARVAGLKDYSHLDKERLLEILESSIVFE